LHSFRSYYSQRLCTGPRLFLDDWQEKSAQIPDYEIIPKSGNSTSVNILVDMDHVQHKVPAYVYGNNAVAMGWQYE